MDRDDGRQISSFIPVAKRSHHPLGQQALSGTRRCIFRLHPYFRWFFVKGMSTTLRLAHIFSIRKFLDKVLTTGYLKIYLSHVCIR